MIGAVAIREQLLRTIPWHFVKGLFFVKLSFSQRTAETKFDRLYLIIDEAHRSARNVKEQLTVMQKFINGSVDDGLSPLPVTVGVSATIERFNELVKNSGAAINPCAVPVDDVRGAGLPEDRIIVIYPDEGERDMSMLHAADAKFHVGEIVHTFGNKQDLTINGLKVVYREPSNISDDERIKIVLFELARLLNQTEIYHAALDEVINELVGKIRAHVEELKASGEYDSAAQRIRNFKISADVIDLERNKTYGAAANLFSSLETDTDRQFEAAKRVFGDDTVANTYRRRYNDPTDADIAKIDVILFADSAARVDDLQKFAKDKLNDFDKCRREFARASSAYREAYDENSSARDKPGNFHLPEVITVKNYIDGREFADHLFVDAATGIARIKLNDWELGTLIEEQRRADFVCWLRNFDRKDRALSLVYADEHGVTKNFFPDMLIVRKAADGFVVDVLEPHDSTRRDNLGKAQALAKYARDNPTVGRVELIRKDGNFFRRLDMSRDEVCKEVLSAKTNAELDNVFAEHGKVF